MTKTLEDKVKNLESTIKLQSKQIEQLARKLVILEKEFSRRKHDIDELKRHARK